MSWEYLKKELSFKKSMFYMLINMKVIYKLIDSIIFDEFGQACPNYQGKFTISLGHLKKRVRNEVRDSTELAVLGTSLVIYYTSNVIPPLTYFLSQNGIHNKSFPHLINCLCDISSLLFQVVVGQCTLAFFKIGIYSM